MRKTKIIASLPDLHDPYSIELRPILKYLSDLQPDIINYLGDTSNAESCNHWKVTHGIKCDVESVEEDYYNLRENILDRFKRAVPKARTNFFIGNHEKWFYDRMEMDPRANYKYGVEDNIDLKHYNMTIVPFNNVISYGYLNFMHGIYVNDNHAKKTAVNYRKCTIYGHKHDIQTHTIHSPIDNEDKIVAKSIGCLCEMNPAYMRNKPSQWVNAFNVAYIRSDGSFNDYTIVITRGKFTAPNGKEYKI